MDKFAARRSETALHFSEKCGQPIANQTIRAKLKKHEFLFGAGAFFTVELTSGASGERKEYLTRIYDEWKQVFNYTTLPFYLGSYEPVRGQTRQEATLTAARMLTGDGKTIKGHPLCWHTVAAKWMFDMSEEEVLDYFLYRIEREMNAFHGMVSLWDVINEAVIMPEFCNEPRMNPVTRLCRKLGRVELAKALFDRAHAADPGATLLINDFNTSERYADLIRGCLDAGVKIDTIGIQSHQHQGFWGPEKLMEVTERFERFGLPIHYTENTFVSGDLMPAHIVDLNDFHADSWPSTPEGEQRQKEDMMAMMEYLFTRPLVTGFTTWDFEDHQWLRAPSGLIHSDGRPKPALTALKEKLQGEWHTDVCLHTDENGNAVLNGFRGEYELSLADRNTDYVLKKDIPREDVTL